MRKIWLLPGGGGLAQEGASGVVYGLMVGLGLGRWGL